MSTKAVATPSRVLSVQLGSNADLIAEVAKLWIKPDDEILDVTYGRGNWWTKYPVVHLLTNDLDPESSADDHYDFRDLPEAWANLFDVIAFDPPYVSKGGRDTSGIPEMDAAYGLYDAPKDPAALWEWIDDGIHSLTDALDSKGRLLVKCSDFISSGRYEDGLMNVTASALDAGLTHVDTFIHFSGTGPQPLKNRDGTPRRQVHSRRAHSYLAVFQKGSR